MVAMALVKVCAWDAKTKKQKNDFGPDLTIRFWHNFTIQVVLPEEWQENFQRSRDSLYQLSNLLRLYPKLG